MAIKTHKRSELRDTLAKRDAAATKTGQAAAARYLRNKELPPTRGNIRAGIAFAILTMAILVIVLAL